MLSIITVLYRYGKISGISLLLVLSLRVYNSNLSQTWCSAVHTDWFSVIGMQIELQRKKFSLGSFDGTNEFQLYSEKTQLVF